MIKKIGLLSTFILCLTFTQSSAFAKTQDFRQTYTDYTPYAQTLQDKIVTNWNPKTIKKERNAIVSIKVNKDGTLEAIKIQKSSNKKKFDNEIIDSITNSVPLGCLPTDSSVESKNFQLNFIYKKTRAKNTSSKHIIANVYNQDGYDQYIEQVDNVIAKKVNDKSYYCKKDILLEMNINKSGKLLYVKVKNPSVKNDFNKKEFNRKTLLTLQNTSFPSIPDKMGLNDITVNYRVLTQRERLFRNYVFDYVLNFFRTGTESFCVPNSPNL